MKSKSIKQQGFVLTGVLVVLLLGGVWFLWTTAPGQAQPNNCSSSYCLDWRTLSGGLPEMRSASYSLNATLGQSMAQSFSSSNYDLSTGYWQGASDNSALHIPIIIRED